MTLTPEQIAKLPKWAQAEFARLSAKVVSLQDTLEALAAPAEEANITYRLPAEPTWRALPNGAEVRFRDGRGWISLHYPASGEGVALMSSRALIVRPRAANALDLRDDA